MRLFFSHIEPFHGALFPLLREAGCTIGYLCANAGDLETFLGDVATAAPGAFIHPFHEAAQGAPPRLSSGERLETAPVSATLLQALTAGEADVYGMMARYSRRPLPFGVMRQRFLQWASNAEAILTHAGTPDAIIFHGAPHMGCDYTLYLAARALGVRVRVVDRTYIPDALLMNPAVEASPVPSPADLDAVNEDAVAALLPELNRENYYDARNQHFAAPPVSNLGAAALYGRMARRLWNNGRTALAQWSTLAKPIPFASRYAMARPDGEMPRRWLALVHETLDALRLERLRTTYERRAAAFHTLPADARFVYMPLQLMPERTSLPLGGVFHDQLHMAQMTAAALPAGFHLVIKEHPRQFKTPNRFQTGRGEAFYRRLFELPADRVLLAPLGTDSKTLMSRAACTAVMTGTSGWEALRAGKPALIFGHPWFQGCPGALRAGSVQECREALSRIAAGEHVVDINRVAAYMHWLLEKASFTGAFSRVLDSSLSSETVAEHYRDALLTSLGAS